MGHIAIGDHQPKSTNLVAEIEGIIHDHGRLAAFVREARASLRATGLLPHDRIWDYLHWRRALDPPRFDHYHPEFVRLFRWEQRDIERMHHHPTMTGALSGSPVIPETLAPSGHPPGSPSRFPGAAVPEPGTFTLGLVAIAFGAAMIVARWARKRSTGLCRSGRAWARCRTPTPEARCRGA
jgi:hypothetical protein